jgi:integrase
LTEESKLILGRRMDGDSRWIFPSPKTPGGRLTKLNGAHDRCCEHEPGCRKDDRCQCVRLSFVLYDFRPTFATRMAQAGVDLATLAAILGQIHCGL